MAGQKVRMVKTPLVLPADLLESIDKLLGKRRRSKFVAEAAWKELKRLRLQRALDRAAGVWKDEDHPELVERGTYHWVRETREGANERLGEITR